jgi:hypothetical protein
MLEKAQHYLEDYKDQIKYIHGSYTDISTPADFILIDLGVNMEHFKDRER